MDDEMSANRTALKTRRRCADELERLLHEHTESEDANGGRALFDPGLREIHALARRRLAKEAKPTLQGVHAQQGGYVPPKLVFEREDALGLQEQIEGWSTTPRQIDQRSLLAVLTHATGAYVRGPMTPEVLHLVHARAQVALLDWLNRVYACVVPTDWEIAVATSRSTVRDFPALEGALLEAVGSLTPNDVLLIARNRKEGRYLSIAELEELVLTFEREFLRGRVCGVCRGRQFRSPGGVTCEQGHGGVESIPCPDCGGEDSENPIWPPHVACPRCGARSVKF